MFTVTVAPGARVGQDSVELVYVSPLGSLTMYSENPEFAVPTLVRTTVTFVGELTRKDPRLRLSLFVVDAGQPAPQ